MEHYDAPKMPVACNVENCSYNKNQMCHAYKIQVSAAGNGKARTSDGTHCSTFENKIE